MKQSLKSKIFAYFYTKENRNETEEYILKKMEQEIDLYDICDFGENEIENAGYDPYSVNERDRIRIAAELSDNYLSEMFWSDFDRLLKKYGAKKLEGKE